MDSDNQQPDPQRLEEQSLQVDINTTPPISQSVGASTYAARRPGENLGEVRSRLFPYTSSPLDLGPRQTEEPVMTPTPASASKSTDPTLVDLESPPPTEKTPQLTSQPIRVEELFGLLQEVMAQAKTPPPPTPSPPPTQSDLLSQLLTALKPPQPVVPATPEPASSTSLLAQLVDQLKRQKAPEPTPPPPPPTENIARELLKTLQAMAGEGSAGPPRTARMPVSIVNSKFCDWVANYPLPDRQRVPSIVGTYDGTRDPEDHLALYEQAIMTEKWVDPVACHMFPGTVQGFARD